MTFMDLNVYFREMWSVACNLVWSVKCLSAFLWTKHNQEHQLLPDVNSGYINKVMLSFSSRFHAWHHFLYVTELSYQRQQQEKIDLGVNKTN